MDEVCGEMLVDTISENGRGSSRSGSIRTGGERDSLPLAGNKEKANLSRSRYVEEVTIAL